MWAQVLEGHLKDAKTKWDQWERGATTRKESRKANIPACCRAALAIMAKARNVIRPGGGTLGSNRSGLKPECLCGHFSQLSAFPGPTSAV